MRKIRPRLVIVEDEEQIRTQMLLYFEDYDEFTIAAAGSGEEALRMLEIEPASICIVDIRLPGMDGIAFIQAARTAGLCRHFLVHTGTTDHELHRSLNWLGVDDRDILLKPYEMNRILDRVRSVLLSCDERGL